MEFLERLKNEVAIDSPVDINFEVASKEELKSENNLALQKVASFDNWLETNRDELTINKEKIEEAVELGLITNSEPETVWRYQKEKLEKDLEKMLEVKLFIEKNIKKIKLSINQRIESSIPIRGKITANLNFKINELADFCVEEKNITADLRRLSHSQNLMQDIVDGVTHEIFHAWFQRALPEYHKEKNDSDVDALKKETVVALINEGLATYLGRQDLQAFHESRSKNYDKYKEESFQLLEELLSSDDINEIKEIQKKAFQDMGPFYVIGYEIAKKMLDNTTDESRKFKINEIIDNLRRDPLEFIENALLKLGGKQNYETGGKNAASSSADVLKINY
ncbi:MAG TPA: hypothetical protein GX706_01140 [Candidatus Moranbacteria bacterium]|nr:hypothetical protein [Candidatus Moranbacteria bacterium]